MWGEKGLKSQTELHSTDTLHQTHISIAACSFLSPFCPCRRHLIFNPRPHRLVPEHRVTNQYTLYIKMNTFLNASRLLSKNVVSSVISKTAIGTASPSRQMSMLTQQPNVSGVPACIIADSANQLFPFITRPLFLTDITEKTLPSRRDGCQNRSKAL